MILIALPTLLHCALTAKITEAIFDGNYAVGCNHLQDKWDLTYISRPYCPWIVVKTVITLLYYKVVVLFYVLFPSWKYSNRRVIWRTSTRRHEASLQRHLGVPQAQGNLSLQAALAHPVRKKETADVSVSSDKGMMRGMTGERVRCSGSPALLGSLALHEHRASPVDHKQGTKPTVLWQVLNGVIPQ